MHPVRIDCHESTIADCTMATATARAKLYQGFPGTEALGLALQLYLNHDEALGSQPRVYSQALIEWQQDTTSSGVCASLARKGQKQI